MAHLTEERNVVAILDSIESGAFKSALDQISRIAKKNKILQPVYKALKALALARFGREQDELEANALCDELLTVKTTDERLVVLIQKALLELERPFDTIILLDEAFKYATDKKTAVKLGVHTFFAHAKLGDWKGAYQTASKLHKVSGDAMHGCWTAMAAFLQATDPSTPESMRPVMLKIALKVIESCQKTGHLKPERLYLHAQILEGLDRDMDAFNLLSGDDTRRRVGDLFPPLDEKRSEISLRVRWREEGELAREALASSNDHGHDWDVPLALINASIFAVVPQDSSLPVTLNEEQRMRLESSAQSCRCIFESVAKRAIRVAFEDQYSAVLDQPMVNWRANLRMAYLALFELQNRLDEFNIEVVDRASIIRLYFMQLANLPVAHEDIIAHIRILYEKDQNLLASLRVSVELIRDEMSIEDLPQVVNKQKAIRALLPASAIVLENELKQAVRFAQLHKDALHLVDVPDRESTPSLVDDFAILSAQAFVSAWKISGEAGYLLPAVCILERANACRRGFPAPAVRLILARIYTLLGCGASLAAAHYLQLGDGVAPGGMFHDQIAHFILARAASAAFAGDGDFDAANGGTAVAGGGAARMMQLCAEANMVYRRVGGTVEDALVVAFEHENYAQISDFIALEDRLDNSLQQDLNDFEHARIALLWSDPPSQTSLESFDAEIRKMKFILERVHFDNRSWSNIPNFQPLCMASFEDQTSMGPSRTPGIGWLNVFVKLYLRALATPAQLADDQERAAVLARLGAPLPTPESSIEKRIHEVVETEMAELTEDERGLVRFMDTVLEWSARPAETPLSDDLVHDFDAAVTRCEELLNDDKVAQWPVLHAVTTRYVLFYLVSSTKISESSSKTKSRKKIKSLPLAAQSVNDHLAQSLQRLPRAMTQRVERIDNMSYAHYCTSLKDMLDVASVIDRLIVVQKATLLGLARGISISLA